MKKDKEEKAKELANQSKGMGNPGGSQSGGSSEKESTEQLKKDSQNEKDRRKDEEGNFNGDASEVRTS